MVRDDRARAGPLRAAAERWAVARSRSLKRATHEHQSVDLPLRPQRPVHRRALRQVPGAPGIGRSSLAQVLLRPRGRRARSSSTTSAAPPGRRASARSRSRAKTATRTATATMTRPSTVRAARPQDLKRAARDSLRAMMLIRAYRVRGHLEASLDPLGLKPRAKHPELDPRTYGFTEADLDRPIYHRQRARLRERDACARSSRCCARPIAARSASSTCTSRIRTRSKWIQERIEGSRNQRRLHRPRQARDPGAPDRGRDLRAVPRQEIHRHQALRPRRRRDP